MKSLILLIVCVAIAVTNVTATSKTDILTEADLFIDAALRDYKLKVLQEFKNSYGRIFINFIFKMYFFNYLLKNKKN